LVQMITYNHGDYIREAIDSVMMQQTTFPFRLLICDDCSTDITGAICRELKERYPDKIELVLNPQNMGPSRNADQIIDLSVNSGAKYIAVCEGDDYWTDPLKLQKQADYLEAHPDFSMCFHKVFEQRGAEKKLSSLNESMQSVTYTVEDLAKSNIIHTPSVMYRNGLFKVLPPWLAKTGAGDYVLHMLNAQHGLIRYMPEPMAVYRLHGGGTWSGRSMGEKYPKWLLLLDHLMTEDFSPAVKENLLGQKRLRLKEYLLWLLDNEPDQRTAEILNAYYDADDQLGHRLLTETFLQYISLNRSKDAELRSSKTYKLASLLSRIKNRVTREMRSPIALPNTTPL